MKNEVRAFIMVAVLFLMLGNKASASEKFDPSFYTKQNPDVVEALGTDPEVLYEHYMAHGKQEGRLPNSDAGTIPVIPVTRIGNTHDNVYEEIIAQLSFIPNELKQVFLDKDWELIHTSENIAKTEFGGQYKSVRGMTNYDAHYIKIHDRMIAAQTAVSHEFGHFLYRYAERYYGKKQKAVYDAFESEKDNIGKPLSGTNGLSNPEEFYAEVFYLYCTDEENAEAFYPDMVSYIREDLEYVSSLTD